MRFSLPTSYALMSIFLAAGSAQACAVPKPFFSELFDADAVIRGAFQKYEVLKLGYEARVTVVNLETLKGNVPSGRLAIYWRRHGIADQWKGPQDLIVALQRTQSPAGDEYEVMDAGFKPFIRPTNTGTLYWTSSAEALAEAKRRCRAGRLCKSAAVSWGSIAPHHLPT